jgi:Uma2 family endonuclease
MDVLVMNYPETDYETERNKPMPSKNHGVTQTNLNGLIFMNYRKKYRIISEIALELGDWKSVPDLAIFDKMDIDFIHDEIRMIETPLGVIEILSPTQGLQELNDKAERYFLCGVKSVWLVIPSMQTIAIYHSPYEFELFTKGIANDSVLDIAVELKEVFS